MFDEKVLLQTFSIMLTYFVTRGLTIGSGIVVLLLIFYK